MITLERNNHCINIDRLIKRHSTIRYDYNSIHIKLNNKTIGYIAEYNIPKSKSTYIDIYILEQYRNKGYGTIAINLYTDINKNIGIISDNNSKTKFLLYNGFYLDPIHIYKTLYRYEGGNNG